MKSLAMSKQNERAEKWAAGALQAPEEGNMMLNAG